MWIKKIIFALVLVSIHSYAQLEYSPTELFDEGIYFMDREDFVESSYYFKNLALKYPENCHYNFLAGVCYLNIQNKEHLSIPYFEIAINNLVEKKKHRLRSFDETAAPLHAVFYLGIAYRANNQLTEALEMYKQFVESPLYSYNYNDNVVAQEVKSCEMALTIQKEPIQVHAEKLPLGVNSEFVESNPVLSGNGQVLVFVRTLKFYDAVYYSKKENDNWSTPVNISPQIVSDGNFYPTAVSYDGKKMLLIKIGANQSDIYSSNFNNNTWSPAVKLQGKINSLGNETSATFLKDTNHIILTSNRIGGKGGYDIYSTTLNTDKNKWSKPKKIKNLSSDYDETSISYNKQCQKLYFSSKGHSNMGGYDIFSSSAVGKTWELPQNIGYPINSTRDNKNFTPGPDCNTVILAKPDSNNADVSDLWLIRIIE
ncbi:MAG: hypothetical protein MI922_09420 [Bacteroidales bacterium]|nr:hypothetical protein [Bacteroidales bacterium]